MSNTPKAGLYLVSTPIGNLEDITLRALKILKAADIILCEDTRVSSKLLAKHGISTALTVYNDNSDDKRRRYVMGLIEQQKVVCLISDAGTPLISDPGYKLVRQLQEAGYYFDVIPGASSPIAALTLSGLPSNCFLFSGFIPKTPVGRAKFFGKFARLEATLIFFETANRLLDSLECAYQQFGDKSASVVREISKLHQEVKNGAISELIAYYRDNKPRGEIVLLIDGSDGVKVRAKMQDDIDMAATTALGVQSTASGETGIGCVVANVARPELQQKAIELFRQGESARKITDILYAENRKTNSRRDIYNLVNGVKSLL